MLVYLYKSFNDQFLNCSLPKALKSFSSLRYWHLNGETKARVTIKKRFIKSKLENPELLLGIESGTHWSWRKLKTNGKPL